MRGRAHGHAHTIVQPPRVGARMTYAARPNRRRRQHLKHRVGMSRHKELLVRELALEVHKRRRRDASPSTPRRLLRHARVVVVVKERHTAAHGTQNAGPTGSHAPQNSRTLESLKRLAANEWTEVHTRAATSSLLAHTRHGPCKCPHSTSSLVSTTHILTH